MVFLNLLIIWTNFSIDIPVHDSLEYYKYIPEAHLLDEDNEIIIDPDMYYEMEVDRTFFSVVNTNLLGTYTVKYRVYYPNYNKQSTQTIYFNIVDNIPPEITYIPQYRYPVGSKNIDLTNGIKLKDNYDDEKSLDIKIINMHEVNTNVVGSYEIIYEVKDLSNNINTYTHNVFIYDNISPTILPLGDIKIEMGGKFDYTKHFQITDNVDKLIIVNINDDNVNYHIKGLYNAIITATDQSGNQTTLEFLITITDSSPPVLILKQKAVTINIFEPKDLSFYHSLILHVSDNNDNLTTDDVIITDYVSYDTLGTYDVIYTLKDSSDNQTTIILKVNIVDSIPPNIESINLFEINVNTLFIPLDEYFLITDNYSANNKISKNIKATYDLTKTGVYQVTIEVSDENNNKNSLISFLYVVDKIAPIITYDSNIEVSSIDELSNYILIDDNYDSNPLYTLNTSNVILYQTGTFPITITAVDSSNNETVLHTFVTIVDKIPPIIKSQRTYITISYLDNDDKLDELYKSLYLTITDDYTPVNEIKISYINNIIWNQVGTYEIIITAFDNSNNYSVYKVSVIVEDKIPPLLLDNDEIITFNKPFFIKEIKKHLNVYDYSKNIKVLIEDENTLINKSGLYYLNINISDEYGNNEIYQIQIKLLKEPLYKNIYFWISGIILLSTSSLALIFRNKTKIKKQHFDNY